MRNKLETFNGSYYVYLLYIILISLKYIYPLMPESFDIPFDQNYFILIIFVSLKLIYLSVIKWLNRKLTCYEYYLFVPSFLLITLLYSFLYRINTSPSLLELNLLKLQFIKLTYYLVYYKISLPITLI